MGNQFSERERDSSGLAWDWRWHDFLYSIFRLNLRKVLIVKFPRNASRVWVAESLFVFCALTRFRWRIEAAAAAADDDNATWVQWVQGWREGLGAGRLRFESVVRRGLVSNPSRICVILRQLWHVWHCFLLFSFLALFFLAFFWLFVFLLRFLSDIFV